MLLIYHFDGSWDPGEGPAHGMKEKIQNFLRQVVEEGSNAQRVNVAGWAPYERAGKCSVPQVLWSPKRKEWMRSILAQG